MANILPTPLYFDGEPITSRFSESGFTQVRSTSTHTEIVGINGQMYSIPNVVPSYRTVVLHSENSEEIHLEVSNKDNTVSVDLDAMLVLLNMAGYDTDYKE